MLKKYITLMLAAAALAAAGISVSAEDFAVSDITDKYVFEVSGEADGDSVGLTVLKRGGSWSASEAVADGKNGDAVQIDEIAVTDGKYKASFPVSAKSGVYEILVGNEKGEQLRKILLIYAGKTENDAAVAELKNQPTKDDMIAYAKNNRYALQLYLPLSNETDESTVFEELLPGYITSNSGADGEDIADFYRRSVIIRALNENKIDNIDTYYKYLNIGNGNIDKWYGRCDDETKTAITAKLKNIADEEDLSNKIIEELILQRVRKPDGYMNIYDILNDFSDKTGFPSSIVTTSACSAVAGNTYQTLSDLKTALSGTQQGGGGSVSSSKGSSLGGAAFASPALQENTIEPLTSESFGDISGHMWAKEAVEALFAKGIVSGRTGDTFAPADCVTREEFAKMLVLALDLQNNSKNVTFDDVDAAAWYAPYVDSLVNSGAASGISENLFGVGMPITRQDMAVMIYRGIENKEETDFEAQFTDSAAISEYARDAVNYINFKGYINGYEDGSFRPLGSVTRAEAAVVLYNLIK